MTGSVGNRVLMLLENSTYPGDPRVRAEARTLAGDGYRVTVIAPANKDQPWHETVDGVQVYRYQQPFSGDGFVGYLGEYGYSLVATFLLSMLVYARQGFDIIHAHNPHDLFVLIAMCYRLVGVRFIFDHHDLSPEMYRARFQGGGNRLVFFVLTLFEQLSCKMAHHIIATNESYKRIQMERGGVPAERISIVRNGPNLKRVRLVDPDPEIQAKAGTILGFVGEMGYQDGVDYLLRAVKHLTEDLGRKDIFCVMVGRGDAYASLLELNRELELEDYVWFAGRAPDDEMLSYLSAADICLDPDPSNAFTDRSTMIKIMEYMALGKPVVAFDLPEHRVSGGEAAVYAKANDEMDFARKIALLMDNSEQRERRGVMGRQRVEEQLAWRHQEPNLLRAYEIVRFGADDPPVAATAESPGGNRVPQQAAQNGASTAAVSSEPTPENHAITRS